MIYFLIEPWMAEENPAFAAAVDRFYSIAHGTLNDAAIGEVALRRLAKKRLLERGYIAPDLAAKLAAWVEADLKALDDPNYFRRMAAAVAKKGVYRQHPIEYVFEGYRYLRRREGPGSPLPNKKEVKRIASLIWAFKDVGIIAKLPEYLGDNTGLSQKEQNTVLSRQEHHLASRDKENWSVLAQARRAFRTETTASRIGSNLWRKKGEFIPRGTWSLLCAVAKILPHQKLLRAGKIGWVRPRDLPFSRGHVYRLLFEGILESVELRVPGSKRAVRLINGDSLDRYLRSLSKQQKAARQSFKPKP